MTPRRRLVLLSTVFGVFLLADLAGFGWWIVHSLSQRNLEEVLFETKKEARSLASQIQGQAERRGQDLFTAVASQRETQTYIDSVLRQRDIIETVEVRDSHGVVVLRSRRETAIPLDPAATTAGTVPGASDGLGAPMRVESRSFDSESNYDVTVPIGQLGELYVGVSRSQLENRIAVLRTDLTRQAATIGGLTLAILLAAFWAVLWLWRRGRRLEEQAAEAERMAYVGTLASGLAHEIRNPLNSLNLNMQMLDEDLPQDALGGRRLLAITRGEIHRLDGLVTDFLSYARPRPLELESCAALHLLEHTAAVIAAEAEERGVRLQVIDRSGGARVRVDRSQIHQALLNLVRNAFAAMESGERSPRLTLSVDKVGASRLALDVADNGSGMSADQQRRVFDVFFSTKKGGTGLGLAIVRRIVHAHQGEIEVESRPGEGTRMRLLLPVLSSASETRG
jgi:signal transduction histidine kinase